MGTPCFEEPGYTIKQNLFQMFISITTSSVCCHAKKLRSWEPSPDNEERLGFCSKPIHVFSQPKSKIGGLTGF
jgi:hypothetical protein